MKLPNACKERLGIIFCNKDNKEIEMESCRWSLGSNSSCKGVDGKDYYFPDILLPTNTDDEHKIEEKTLGILNEGNKKIKAYDKDLFFSGHLGDIGDEGDKLVIKSYFNKLIVREIKVGKDDLTIKAGNDEPLVLPKNLSIYYEPWFMDRGSYVFFNPKDGAFPKGEILKLGTELDLLEEDKR